MVEPPPPQTDAELLSAFRTGQHAAFSVLYERHSDALFLHARALMRDDGLAEDLVHECFLRALKVLGPGGPSSGSFAPFLHQTLRRLAIDRLRSEKALRRREAKSGPRWVRAEDPTLPDESVTELNRVLPLLPKEQLEVLILHLYGGMTFAEISQALQAPLKTIISRYRYALKKLADLLGGPNERE